MGLTENICNFTIVIRTISSSYENFISFSCFSDFSNFNLAAKRGDVFVCDPKLPFFKEKYPFFIRAFYFLFVLVCSERFFNV